ncbi:iron ABC transporter permease [Shimia sp. R10_1]|uniref:FecCD family ABC transporter permease n=1 Tax=Shimia sp. R10_1 TaxID=2821095 RepID=UPI001ADB91FA|nr:iron ABC transporter permease [Shimia sp. R10_1]MBO9474206.1 iron ABC transporter permease [Shimia sp. R10_1]
MTMLADQSLPVRRDRRPAVFLLAVLGLGVLSVLSLRLGFRPLDWPSVWSAFTDFDGNSAAQIVVLDIRFPRLLAALLAGSALGVAGALIQGMTRNPLADPGLLGINAGAAFGVVTVVFALGWSDPRQFVWVAMAGGTVGAVLVFALGGGAQASPARLLLAGAAITAFFLAMSRAVLLMSRQSLDVYRFWVLGGLDGISTADVQGLLFFFVAGFGIAIVAAFLLNALMLGEDTARGLGVNVGLAKLITGAGIVCLASSTVAMAGPIAFIGLMVPHLARPLSQQDMRWQVAFSAVLGAVLMVCADLVGRLPLLGGNMQAGVMAALIGGPALVIMVRRSGGRAL